MTAEPKPPPSDGETYLVKPEASAWTRKAGPPAVVKNGVMTVFESHHALPAEALRIVVR